METRIRVLLLNATRIGAAVALVSLSGCSVFGSASGTDADSAALAATPPARSVIDPQIERREIPRARIDTEDFELGAYGGFVSIEDFGTQAVYGARLAYHVDERFFAEAFIGESEAGATSFETLAGDVQLLTDDERRYRFYDLSLGYNLLPGEVFLGKRAFDSSLYVLAGAGSTEFAGESRFTASFGTGYRVMLLDGLSVHFLVRDRLFDSDLLGEDKVTHNIEFSLGANWFF